MIAMTLYLYKYTGDKRVMRKNVGNVIKSLSCQLKEECDVVEPTIIIKTDMSLFKRNNINYFYLKEWDRYYYVSDITANPDGTISVKGLEDVLYTWKDKLNSLTVVVARSSGGGTGGNEYFPDNKAVFDVRPQVTTIPFVKGTNDGFLDTLTYVIQTSGA